MTLTNTITCGKYMVMARKTYTTEQKAEAIGRVAAGESPSDVARDMDVERVAIYNWMNRDKGRVSVTDVVTRSTYADQLRQDVAGVLHASLITLRKHAELYGSDEWLKQSDKRIILESTRTIGSRFSAIMDRLGGQVGTGDDDSDQT